MIYAELDDEFPGKIVIRDFEWRYKESLSNIPGASFRKDKYLLPLEWATALAMQANLGQNLKVSDELMSWMSNHYNTRILPAYNIRNQPSIEEGYDFLYPHQKADVKFIEASRRAILANDLGSGKSISATAGIRNLSEKGEDVFPILVTCPNSTKIGWAKEFEKAWPGRKITIVEGTATQRRKQFKEFSENGGEVLIMNWELVRQHSRLQAYGGIALKRCTECGGLDPKVKSTACEAHQKELNEIDFKAVIGDEIHRISDPSSKVSRAFKNASGDADIRIALSGTPINATPDQLYSALNWLYPDAYPSKVKFLDRFCDMVPGEWGGTVVLGVKKHMEAEFFAGLDPILRRMPKSVILPFLPPVVRVRRDVDMSPKQAKAYKQMAEKMMAEVGDNDVTTTTSPLVQLLRMLQFASAYVEVSYEKVLDTDSPFPDTYIDKEILTMSDPSSKLDAFMDDIEDFGDSSVVVFAHHKQLIDLLTTRLDKQGIHYGLITGDQDVVERQAYMDAFQEGRIKFILCTIQAGGTGITLTKADTMVFLQRSYSMIDNLQAEGRAHRIGSEQHEQVTIIDYVSTDTADESVLEAIEKKQENLEFILRDNQVINDFLSGKFDFNDEDDENEDK